MRNKIFRRDLFYYSFQDLFFCILEARHELTNIAISWNHIATIEVLVGLKNDYVRFFIEYF